MGVEEREGFYGWLRHGHGVGSLQGKASIPLKFLVIDRVVYLRSCEFRRVGSATGLAFYKTSRLFFGPNLHHEGVMTGHILVVAEPSDHILLSRQVLEFFDLPM